MEDYDFTLQYRLGKANVVADALSRKPRGLLASLVLEDWKRIVIVEDMISSITRLMTLPLFTTLLPH